MPPTKTMAERLRKLERLSCFRAPPSDAEAVVIFGHWPQVTRIHAVVAELGLNAGSKVFFSGDRFEAKFFTDTFPPQDTWAVDGKAKSTDDSAIAATKFLHDAGVTGAVVLVAFPTLAEGSLRALLHHAQLPSERVYPVFQASAEIAGDAGVADGWIDAKLKASEAGDWAGKFNFSPAWEASGPSDPLVYGIAAPGVAQVKIGDMSISSTTIKAWADFVKAKGISHVLCLLNERELACYEQVESYEAALTAHGLKVTLVDMDTDKRAQDRLLEAVAVAYAMREKIVVQCKEGADRTGVALGTVLVCLGGLVGAAEGVPTTTVAGRGVDMWDGVPKEYQFILPGDAAERIAETASKAGAFRRFSLGGIQLMLHDGYVPDGYQW